ncbi:hypothetical protein [Marinobacter zhejiangensis]|uniref:Lipoprotein n=1 Tax=Marinobacter zhejiangensis TaxID=488535 RepID=A0A1I4L9N3_9GAMM|nr:hypothetical protein [Marinobacter zhejiangensis]SFL87670.1 hypothetical protein SAMN04487963_0358 [Marinobacter zhejiangensis]
MMNRYHFASVVWLIAVLVGLTGCAQKPLQVEPSLGDQRLYTIQRHSELETTNLFGRPTRIPALLTMQLQAEVSGTGPEGVTLTTSSMASRLEVRQRLVFDSERTDGELAAVEALARALMTGTVEQVSPGGEVVGFSMVDEPAWQQLRESRREPEWLLEEFQRGMSLFAVFKPQLPEQALDVGATWISEETRFGGAVFPALEYRVTQVLEESVILEFTGVPGTAGDGSQGYLELEIGTGWPRRAQARLTMLVESKGETVPMTSRVALQQSGLRPALNLAVTDDFLHRLKLAMAPMPIDMTSDRARGVLPPPEQFAIDDLVEQFDRSLLWFDERNDAGARGLNADVRSSADRYVDYTVDAVRAKSGPGASEVSTLQVNPDFDFALLAGSTRPYPVVRVPFVLSAMTPELAADIQAFELDVTLAVPGNLVTVSLKPDTPIVRVEETDLDVVVEEWSANRVLLKLRQSEGFLPSDPLGRVLLMPTGANGEPLDRFNVRISHDLLERFAAEYVPGERRSVEGFAEFVQDQLIAVPVQQRYGDLVVELWADQPIDALKVFSYPYLQVSHTFIVPNASRALAGGAVVGERHWIGQSRLDRSAPPMSMDEVVARLFEDGRLTVELPREFDPRCSISVDGESDYQGNSLTFNSSYERETDKIVYALTAGNRERYFHNFDVDVVARCATEIETLKGPVDTLDGLEQIDQHTVQVSSDVLQDLQRLRGLKNYEGIPIAAFNTNGEYLQAVTTAEELMGADSREPFNVRFWGPIANVEYPRILTENSNSYQVSFPAKAPESIQ